ncbi:hypothetical protein PR003_g25877 [Phytophthora rubi]|uniref:Uncharacterized protein n=1 Tax=Phytophthora rubi TaxID=129364 RepID=A0A6A3IV29_9STRA|nr:hypothetical protein PR001_g22837 [Phytophthora rubi]KAE9288133.1 hypothetical protein PR003_g25877 [Phytophthora rubi]
MDGDTARMVDTSTVPATAADDKGEVMDSTNAVPKDGSVAAVRKAVAAQLNDELAARESERAERYVSTVRPAMATLRYVHQMDNDDGDDRAGDAVAKHSAEETTVMTENEETVMTAADRDTATTQVAVPADPDEVSASEEGGETMDDACVAEEGATVATETTEVEGTTEAEPSSLELGMELTNEAMVELGSVAAVRMAGKRSKRAAKQLRVQRAQKKTKDKHGDDEVARVVAELERERVLRRQHQADEARGALEVRRQHRAAGDEVRADERARVNLVRHDSTATDGEADGDCEANVEAGDGLPTAAMLVDGAQQLVKIDSGARYSVAGTD